MKKKNLAIVGFKDPFLVGFIKKKFSYIISNIWGKHWQVISTHAQFVVQNDKTRLAKSQVSTDTCKLLLLVNEWWKAVNDAYSAWAYN